MPQLRRFAAPACAATLLIVGLSGCGDNTKLPQAPSSSPFSTSSISVVQQGNAAVTIDTTSVTFKLDDARSLIANLVVRSNATSTITISIRGSIYDPNHALIGDVTGGQVNVSPGTTTPVELTGPTPLGTIAAVTFELSATPTTS